MSDTATGLSDEAASAAESSGIPVRDSVKTKMDNM